MEKSNLPNKEFKVLIIKMFTEHGRRMDEHMKTFNKEKIKRRNRDEEYNN